MRAGRPAGTMVSCQGPLQIRLWLSWVCRRVVMKKIYTLILSVVAMGVLSGSAAAQGVCLDAACLEHDGYRTTSWQAVAPPRARSLEVLPAVPVQTSDWALSVNGELFSSSHGNRLQFDNLPRPADSLDYEPWQEAVRWSAYGRTYMYLVYKGRYRLALPSVADVAVITSTQNSRSSRTSRGGSSPLTTTPATNITQPSSGGSCDMSRCTGTNQPGWCYNNDGSHDC